MLNRTTLLLGLAGLMLATGLVAYNGLGEVMQALSVAGWGIVWASLFHVVPMAFNARAWQVLLPSRRGPGLGFFLWLVWVRESVNGLLPVARVGGELVSARLMLRQGIRAAPAAASLVVDMTLCMGSQFLFTIGGVALLAAGDSTPMSERILYGLLAGVPLIAAFWAVQRAGLFHIFHTVVKAMFGDRWVGLAGTLRRYDHAVRVMYRRSDRTLACLLWQLVGWAAGAGEIWLALLALGHPVSVGDALLIEALIQALSSAAFLVPGALGVQEGGFLAIGALVGLPADIGLALALARRARDLLVFGPALLVWQVIEGRALVTQRSGECRS